MARYVDKEKSQNKFIIITTGSIKAKRFLQICLRVRNIWIYIQNMTDIS